MSDEIHNMTHSLIRDTANQIDAYLLEFFGSLENAKKLAHLYVLETKESEILTEPNANNSFSVSMTTEYRLRLKTEAELADDLGSENM